MPYGEFSPSFLGADWMVKETVAWEIYQPKTTRLLAPPIGDWGSGLPGEDVRTLFQHEQLRGVQALWYFFHHQRAIPLEWKEKTVYFDGTVFEHVSGIRATVFLYYRHGVWQWSPRWLLLPRYACSVCACL